MPLLFACPYCAQIRLQYGIKNKAAIALQRKSYAKVIAALLFITYVVLFKENSGFPISELLHGVTSLFELFDYI